MDVLFSVEFSSTYNYAIDSNVLTKDFSDFGELTNYSPTITIYVNGIKFNDFQFAEYGEEIDEDSIDYYLDDISDALGGYYLDEECTIPLSTLVTVPSSDFDIYTKLEGQGVAMIVIERYLVDYDYKYGPDVYIVELDSLVNNVLDLDEYSLSGYELVAVSVDGVATTEDIVLSEKQLVIIRCDYISAED